MFFLDHSHVASIEGAADRAGFPYESLNLWTYDRLVLYGEAGARLAPALKARLDGFVISTVGGAAHDIVGLRSIPARSRSSFRKRRTCRSIRPRRSCRWRPWPRRSPPGSSRSTST